MKTRHRNLRIRVLGSAFIFFACVLSTGRAVSYDFAAAITSIFTYHAASGNITFLSSASLNGFSFSNGQQVNGTFSYDSSVGISPFDPNGDSDGYASFFAGTSFAVHAPESGIEFSSSLNQQVVLSDNSKSPLNIDTFYQEGFSLVVPGTALMATVSLYDLDGTAWSGFVLPNNLNLGDFETRQFTFNVLDVATGNQLGAIGVIDDLRRSDPVPESASTSVLFVAGLLGLISFRRRSAGIS